METHILKPAVSRLLSDGVQTLMWLLRGADEAWGRERIEYRDHGRSAKRRALEIPSQRALWSQCQAWVSSARAHLDLLSRVCAQTERRMFGGATVPAGEKVVSPFEPHTDILVTGGSATCYGHKINLTTGRSGLALNPVVEERNPPDSSRCLAHFKVYVYSAIFTHNLMCLVRLHPKPA